MKSTFHELELGKVVVQNATPNGSEQLIVSMQGEGKGPIQFQIKENKDGQSSNGGTIEIDEHGLSMLFKWLREEGALH